jgi:hypothetical protein
MKKLKYIYRVSGADGFALGYYRASCLQNARDKCAREAGYRSEADMVKRLGQPSALVAELVLYEH